MAAPWDGRLTTYLGSGLAADRPAAPNIAPGLIALWVSEDTGVISAWVDGAWLDNVGLPGGGADKAVLKKASASDRDVEWGSVEYAEIVGIPAPVPGDGGKIVIVSPDGDGYDYVDGPVAAATSYAVGTRWRIVTDAVGVSGKVGWGEIGWLDEGGSSLGNVGTGVASSEEVGNEAAQAFDFLYFTGNGWRCLAGSEAGSWIEFEFTTAKSVRQFYVRPVYGYPNDAPLEFSIEYYDTDATAWVALGSYVTTWPDSEYQTFTVGPLPAAPVAAELADGDYGDITVSGGGAVMTIDAGAVSYAKMQDVSATKRILGRKTAGAGDVEELTASEILEFLGGAAHGDIIYRNAVGWTLLPAGTAGQVLKTNGAGSDPAWSNVAAVPGSAWFTGGTGDGSVSTAAFSIKGCFFTPSVNLTITAVGCLVDADATTVRHVVGIASLSSVTFDANGGVTAATVNAVMGTSGAGVYIGDTDTVAFEKALTGSVTLTAGQTYFIYCARTDGTGTSVNRVCIGPWKLNAPGVTPVVANGRYSAANSLSGGEVLDISTNNSPACMWVTGTTA